MATLEEIDVERIPKALKSVHSWCLWRQEQRDGSVTKVPYRSDGKTMARANDHNTWTTFTVASAKYFNGGFDGIGFEFGEQPAGMVGVDLDGCRDPQTGKVAEWAREIISQLDTYAEVSPSQTGVKLFCVGKWNGSSHKKAIADAERICDKTPAIEVYDCLRYFAVTGWRLNGPQEPQKRQKQLDAIQKQFWTEKPIQVDWNAPAAIVERARKYLAKIPTAVSGQGGHNATFTAACALVLGFQIEPSAALGLLAEWNEGCQPPWSERELRHKVDSASRQGGPRGYLLNVPIERFHAVKLPAYSEPQPPSEPAIISLQEAANRYLDNIGRHSERIVELGLPELDYAIGGGVERGELVILAARPSHGKSMAALQMVHHWTRQARPSLMISEEMSALALGKRTIQFASEIPAEHWMTSQREVREELAGHFASRAPAYVIEGCRTIDGVCNAIRYAKEKREIQCVVVDYAQLLSAKGKSRYEQISNVSVGLRQVATETQVVLVSLCQLNREIEARQKFEPKLTDLKETGQLEQDADVVIFCVWPHRIAPEKPHNEFHFHIAKNRNRQIHAYGVKCRFEPSRQRLIEEPKVSIPVESLPNYTEEFSTWA